MKKRIISASILLAVVIPLIIVGGFPFSLLIGAVAVFASLEINSLYKYPLIIKLITFIGIITLAYSNFDAYALGFGLDYIKLNLVILSLTVPIIFYQVKEIYTIEDAFKLIGFTLLIGIGLNYFILVRNLSLKYFLLMSLIPIITDTFAYISGMMIGKHKVTKISPKKSLEGYIIGSLMGTFIMSIYYNTVIGIQTNLFIVVAVIFSLTVIAQIGDLFFSAIKRQYKTKDFSNLIPGHGGILDRLDSLIFVGIAFIILIKYL